VGSAHPLRMARLMMRTKMRRWMLNCDAHHSGAAGSAVCAPEGPRSQRAPHVEAAAAQLRGAGSERCEGPLAISGEHLSNATLFDLLDV